MITAKDLIGGMTEHELRNRLQEVLAQNVEGPASLPQKVLSETIKLLQRQSIEIQRLQLLVDQVKQVLIEAGEVDSNA